MTAPFYDQDNDEDRDQYGWPSFWDSLKDAFLILMITATLVALLYPIVH